MSYERVLLPVSGKHSGERALKALSQARKLDPKEIILLHAVAPSVGSPMPLSLIHISEPTRPY